MLSLKRFQVEAQNRNHVINQKALQRRLPEQQRQVLRRIKRIMVVEAGRRRKRRRMNSVPNTGLMRLLINGVTR